LRAGLAGGGAPKETHTDGRWPILHGSTLGAVGIISVIWGFFTAGERSLEVEATSFW
jgi:hypothetical protein